MELVHGDLRTAAPAASKERSLWLLEDLVPGAGVNNLTFTFQAEGPLDGDALQRSLTFLVGRHETLRTVFHTDGETSALRKSVLPADEAEVTVEHHRSEPGTDTLAPLTEYVGTPFAADGSPLLRARHIADPGGDIFCLTVHHSIFDGMSTGIVVEEFSALYDAFTTGAPAPAALAGQAPAWAEPEPSDKSREFWRRQVEGLDVGTLDLGNDKPLPARTTLTGDWVTKALSPQAAAVAKRLQRELRAPEVVILLGAYYVLLAAHGAGPDITVGSPVSVRGRDQAKTIGYHINVLTLRQSVDRDKSFRDLVTTLRRTYLDAVGHADYPVDELLEIVPRVDASWRNSLFRHVFNYIPHSNPEFPIGGGTARLLTVENGYSKFDLEFFVTVLGDSLQLRAAFYQDAYSRSDVELMIDRYEALLLALGTAADEPLTALPTWSERDHAVIEGANDTARDLDHTDVLRAVAEQVALRPDAVAVEDGGHEVSYAELWRQAQYIGEQLLATGAEPGSVVALLCRRGVRLAAAVLGTWLADCVYLPLDPDHPAQRLEYQLTDAGTALAVADTSVEVSVDGLVTIRPDGADGATVELPLPETDPASCAYMIYTSGSTGRPKGTRISHLSLANLIEHFRDELGAGPGSSVLWMTTFSFDISALELLVPLASGGRVVVAPDGARVDGEQLLAVLEQRSIDIVQATPTTWRLVGGHAGGRLAGRAVLSGGEPLPPALARELLATGARLTNVYGPTETTIWSASGRIDSLDDGPLHVGGPIANTQIFVADPDGRELPVGLTGELCIAGTGVGIGYHDRAELTAERFPGHPRHGRYYRTGDLARWLPDGTLEVLGRMDRQVKLRGNRIELAEVESVLLEHPQVRAAAVVLVGDPTTDGALIAFVVAPQDPKVIEDLWSHTRSLLQGAAVPQDFVPVTDFPMTGNDKVNYPELTRIATDLRALAQNTEAVPTDTGDAVVDLLTTLWRELLGSTGLTADAHFFTSGGHSLLGAQLIQKIDRAVGVRLKLADLFANPTPRALADQVRARQS
ncbi:amino acid adenylation domain-containing protein [Streptomyces sp. NBC_01007]|nr:amino acid adenylation domain-containing protein [Streptomyces sp. NBC_01007]WRZ95706.1 amino acid adenylation domain-containing protein [Streptomyces sp. NBC_01007]